MNKKTWIIITIAGVILIGSIAYLVVTLQKQKQENKAMLELAERGALTIEKVVQGMCHAPALLFGIEGRGFLREGYKADLCIVRRNTWTVTKDNILYQCGWSPLEGETFHHEVRTTLVNGNIVYDNGVFPAGIHGEMLTFSKNA